MSAEQFDALSSEAKALMSAGLSDKGKAARDYAKRGYTIIPLRPRSKEPQNIGGCNAGSDDPDFVTWWWLCHPECNVGIVCGKPSGGLLVVDVDNDPDAGKFGAENLATWEEEYGELPATCYATTGNGGTHYLYRTSSKAKTLRNGTFNIDLRGDGGYIVAPPSVHPNGNVYRWEVSPDEREPAFASNEVIALTAFLSSQDEQADNVERREVTVKDAAKNAKVRFPEMVNDGEGRESELTRLAFSLRAQYLEEGEILAVLESVNAERVNPPKDGRDLRRIAHSAAKKPAGPSPAVLAAMKRKEAYEQARLDEQLAAFNAEAGSDLPDVAGIDPKAFEKPRGGMNKEAAALDMLDRFNIARIGGKLAMWDGRRYTMDEGRMKAAICAYHADTSINDRREVMAHLDMRRRESEDAHWRYIGFANGILNLETGEMIAPTPEIKLANFIPWEYAPDAESDVMERFISDVACGDEGTIANLWECAGLVISRYTGAAKAFLLINSKGSNGKSTFMKMLRSLAGAENCCTLYPQLMGERFRAATMAGKLANIADDVPSRFADSDSIAVFKNTVTGDVVASDRKNLEPIEFAPYATQVYSMNDMFSMADMSGGVERRLHPIAFNADFKGREDSRLIEKLTAKEAMECAVRRAVEALRRVIAQGVTATEYSRSMVEGIRLDNDQIALFLVESGWGGNLEGAETQLVYGAYADWTQDAGVRNVFNRQTFTKRCAAAEGLTVRQQRTVGKRVQVFVKC